MGGPLGVGVDLMRRRRTRPIPAPLDATAGQLYAAPALARLLSSWGGPVGRAQRLSDNAQMDVGWAGQWPDMGASSAFAAWLGSASAVWTTLYDQTGNGHHAVQATPSLAPRAALNGVVDVGPNGRPVAVFDGVDDHMQLLASQLFTASQPAITYATVAALVGTTNQSPLVSLTAGGVSRAVFGANGGQVQAAGRRLNADAFLSVAFPTPYGSGLWRRHVLRFRPDIAQADITQNGVSSAFAWHGPGVFDASAQASNTTLGGAPALASYVSGRMSAAVLAQGALGNSALDAALSQIMP